MASTKRTKEELVKVVKEVMECDGTEEEIASKLQWLKQNIVDPKIVNYIFWNGEELTPEEVVDKALKYLPIIV
jgi:hypothetical protein